MEIRTCSRVTPKLLKLSMSFPLTGSLRLLSLTRAKVGWPSFALASTMNFPMYPVPPIIRILLFAAIGFFFSVFFLLAEQAEFSNYSVKKQKVLRVGAHFMDLRAEEQNFYNSLLLGTILKKITSSYLFFFYQYYLKSWSIG